MKKIEDFWSSFQKPIRSEPEPEPEPDQKVLAPAPAPARPKKPGSDGSGSATLDKIQNLQILFHENGKYKSTC